MIRFSGTVVFILCFSITIFSQKKKASFSISGKVTQSSDYCGGVEPSAEMLKQLTKSYAYSGKIFYIKRGKTNALKQKLF